MKNVLLYLTPKSQVAYLCSDFTIRQSLEKMKFHRYTSVPVIDQFGKYVGTITEGDILWYILSFDQFKMVDLEKKYLRDVPRNKDNYAINARYEIDQLIELSGDQNFVPVVDDDNTFIGIITRKQIISHFKNILKDK